MRNMLARLRHPLPLLGLTVCLLPHVVNSGTAPKPPRSTPAPDGVCYPVNGTGYIVTALDGLKIPVGTLSPLVEGDSLIVESGTITVLDFRTGQSPIYGAGTHLSIPPVRTPKRPPWWKRLEDSVIRSLSQPELNRIGGSVRGGGAACWPDSTRFAPGIAVVFEWTGVHPAPTTLEVYTDGDTVQYDLPGPASAHGAFAWRPNAPTGAGGVTWVLRDSSQEHLGGGYFSILSVEAADAERQRYIRAASGVEGAGPRDLVAAVLAAADGVYLW